MRRRRKEGTRRGEAAGWRRSEDGGDVIESEMQEVRELGEGRLVGGNHQYPALSSSQRLPRMDDLVIRPVSLRRQRYGCSPLAGLQDWFTSVFAAPSLALWGSGDRFFAYREMWDLRCLRVSLRV